MAEPNPDAKARNRERWRQYAAENRDKIREKNRKYREANREQLREKHREYYAANGDEIRARERGNYRPEQNRQYYVANRAKISEQQRAYYQANRQEKLEAVKAYAEANPDKIREGRRRYYALRGGKVRLDALKRAHGADFVATWAAMWDAQQGQCYLCERPMDPAEAFMEHWHGCPGHGPKKSCRYCQRGLAHHNCNIVVGQAGDDPAILRIIADNLERANADIAARQAVMPQHITLF
jgi:Recombination endonuclease VII